MVAAARSSLERAGISPTLHAVARWSVAASIGATGCSSAFDHDDFEPPTCSNGEWQPLVGLAPAEIRNHLAVADVGGDIGPNLVAEVGTRCADATDPAACEADFMASWQTSPSPAILSTDGGDVERWSGAPSIARFLGEIDTPQEATLLVWGDGYDVRCGNLERSAVRPLSSGGYQVIASRMTMSCDPVEITRYLIQVGGDGSLRVLEHEVYDSEDGVCVGRRPNGLLPSRRRRSAGALGDHLASIARLEASAVIAFDLLHRELAALGAPRDLLDAVDGARADEVRHARVVARLSRGHGARPRAPRVVDRPLRSALALALDNAAEGCVRETYGAAVGLHQAERAADPDIRAAMRSIAADEVRHAELSWQVGSWLATRLDDPERAHVRSARRVAARRLASDCLAPVDPVVARAAGLPSPPVAAAMVRAMTRTLWA